MRFFTPEERDLWLDAGLGLSDSAIAIACIDVGIQPHHLKLAISGIRVGARLRGGESVGSVYARLHEAGQL